VILADATEPIVLFPDIFRMSQFTVFSGCRNSLFLLFTSYLQPADTTSAIEIKSISQLNNGTDNGHEE